MTLQSKIWSFFFLILTLVASGCGHSVNFSQQPTTSQNVTFPPPGAESAAVPSCLINIPQLELDGNVNSFQMTNSFGITFGYSPTGSTGLTGNLSVSVQEASMDLSMMGLDPLSRQIIATTEVGSNQTNTTIGATIDFASLSANPSLFLSTPLAQVSSTGLAKGIANILTSMNGLPWLGHVLQVPSSSTVILNAGRLAGLQVGDQFSIYNMQSFWQGTPCQSQYLGSQHMPATSIGTVTITSLDAGGAVSFASVVQPSGAPAIMPGAEADVSQLMPGTGKTSRVLKKLAVLGNITAENISLPNGATFNFQSAMNSQIINVVNSSGFVIDSQ